MKILAVASGGGHWIELLRLLPAFKDNEVIFASTKDGFAETVQDFKFYSIPDINRDEKIKLPVASYNIFRLVRSIRPNVIISTGALPGLLALFAGKVYGAKTIWVDSIANAEEFSLSGKIATRFVDRTYTQWPELATKKQLFHGNVLS